MDSDDYEEYENQSLSSDSSDTIDSIGSCESGGMYFYYEVSFPKENDRLRLINSSCLRDTKNAFKGLEPSAYFRNKTLEKAMRNAIRKDKIDILKYLLDKTKIKYIDHILGLCIRYDRFKMFKLFQKYNLSSDVFEYAVKLKRLDFVIWLINDRGICYEGSEHWVNVFLGKEEPNECTYFLLCCLAAGGHVKAFNTMYDSLSITTYELAGIFHYAAMTKQFDIIKELTKRKKDIYIDYYERYRTFDNLKALIEHGGVDVSARLWDRTTLLHKAVWTGNTDVAKYLIINNLVDKNIKDVFGQTAYDLCENEHIKRTLKKVFNEDCHHECVKCGQKAINKFNST